MLTDHFTLISMEQSSKNSILAAKVAAEQLHRELGIPADYAANTKLDFFQEVELNQLVVAQLDDFGRPLVLKAQAAQALKNMCSAASIDGVLLTPFSGFRSYQYQRGLILAKLNKGIKIEEILTILAAPGYSEHHTGEAVDITTVGCPPAEEEFDQTTAYRWLDSNAGKFGFNMSFPRGNPHGLVYEPWHWRFKGS